jgi:prophage regulatory protein
MPRQSVAELTTDLMERVMDQSELKFQTDRRAATTAADIRFIRLKEVLAICGKSRSSVYEAIKKGQFPPPVKLYGRSTAWVKSEVLQWVQACIKASRTDKP